MKRESTQLRRSSGRLRGSMLAHDLTPAAGPVMRNDGPKHSDERLLVDRLPPIDGRGPSRLVFVARGDDALRIGHEGVVERNTFTWSFAARSAQTLPCKTKYGRLVRLMVSVTSGSATCTRALTLQQISCCQSGSDSM